MVQIDKMLDSTYKENTIDWLADLYTAYSNVRRGSYVNFIRRLSKIDITPTQRVFFKEYIKVLTKQPNDNMEVLYSMVVASNSLHIQGSVKPLNIVINPNNQYNTVRDEFLDILSRLGIRETTFLVATLERVLKDKCYV